MPDLESDIRWVQRLQHFKQALIQLQEAVELSQKRKLSRLETQGLIQAFEFCHELAWNTLKDFFFDQGNTSIMGSRDATREAFQKGLIVDGSNWMDMIKSRNLTSHTYHEEIALNIADKIIHSYANLFQELSEKLESQIK